MTRSDCYCPGRDGQQKPPPASRDRNSPEGDPWHAFGYLVPACACVRAVGWAGWTGGWARASWWSIGILWVPDSAST